MGCLRLFLAIAVVLSHTDYQGPRMIKGHDAVHVFFVISGFYMAMILRRKYGFSTQGLGSFAANRFLRLYPSYLAVMMATIGWAAFCHWSTRGEAAIHKIIQAGDMLPLSALVLLRLPNLILLGIDLPAWFELRGDRDIIFANPETNGALWLGETLWVPQAWSIGSEIWFYMLAPMAMAGSAMKKTTALAVVSLILLFSMGGRFLYGGYFIWPFWLWVFCCGLAAFLIYERHGKWFAAPFKRAAFAIPTAALLIGALCFSPTVGFELPKWILVPLAAISTCVLFEATKNNRIDRMIGDLSYPVYLVHVLVMQLVQTMISRFALDWSLLPWLNVAGSLVMAFILIMIVDKRIEIIRQRIYNRSRKSDAALPD